MDKYFQKNNIFFNENCIILNNEEKVKAILKEIKNKEILFRKMKSLHHSDYFQPEKIKIKNFSTSSNRELFQNEVSELFNLSSLKEYSNIRYAFGEKYYHLLFKALLYEKKYLSSSKKSNLSCAFIDDNSGFEEHIKLSYCTSDHLSCKEVFSDINHVERIKFIALILQCAGFLFEIISLDDFILNPILGLCLSRYRYIKQLDEKITDILRCPKCHTSMELDLNCFKEKGLRTQEAYYSCPNCKISSSYTKLLKIYETNKKNSYN